MSNTTPIQQNAVYTISVTSGVVANVILGGSSLFWRALGTISPTTLLSYRILISLITLILVMSILGKFSSFWSQLSYKVVMIHAAAAILVAINWGTFIWASIYGHVVESGLGYLIAPFVAIGVGIFILRDRLSIVRRSALLMIAACIIILLLHSGELSHWIYLVIGITWGGYAYLKKITTLDAFAGLLVETAILSLCLCLALTITPVSLALPQSLPHSTLALLSTCGLFSTIPLWLFARAAGNLPLSVMGFFQFVLPSTQLVVAFLFYQQQISTNTLLCFSVIWLSLLAIVTEPLVIHHQHNKRKL